METNVKAVPVAEKAPKTLVRAAQVAAVTAAPVFFAVSAHAEPLAVPDMTPIVTLITGMVALVASIGMAVLSVYATGKVFKWVKAAF